MLFMMILKLFYNLGDTKKKLPKRVSRKIKKDDELFTKLNILGEGDSADELSSSQESSDTVKRVLDKAGLSEDKLADNLCRTFMNSVKSRDSTGHELLMKKLDELLQKVEKLEVKK